MFFNSLLASDNGGSGNCFSDNPWIFIPIIGIMILFIAWSFISSRKRGKQMNDMRSTMRLGDEVMTIGGIVGTIIEIREKSPVEKEFVIETGVEGSKSTMAFDMRALGENRTRMKEIQAEAARQAEIARQQKEAKRLGTVRVENVENVEKTETETEVTPDDKENK